jgi:amino acid transporter
VWLAANEGRQRQAMCGGSAQELQSVRFSREHICQICFGVLLLVGVGFLFVGLAVVPLLPHFQLDAVLSPGELANPDKRDATLSLLKKAAGNQWLFWAAGGLVVTCTSAIGLWAALQSRHTKEGQ